MRNSNQPSQAGKAQPLLAPMALARCRKLVFCGVCLLLAPWLASDVGAATIVVNTAALTANADDGVCNLNEAVAAAESNLASGTTPGECAAGEPMPAVDVIRFDAGMLPAIITPFAPFALTESVYIDGPGPDQLSLTSIASSRVFTINNLVANTAFTISGMTLRDNALPAAFGTYGGAILASMIANASLTISDVHFIGNNSETGGGALALFGGFDNQTIISDCLFQDNFVQNFNVEPVGGGAIFVGASQSLFVERSTFVGNFVNHLDLANPQADASGGAILVRSPAAPSNSRLEIESSTFSANKTTGFGGAIALGGPGFPLDRSEATIQYSTLTLNEADSNDDNAGTIAGGGAIYSSSPEPIGIRSTIIASNTDRSSMPAADLSAAADSFGYNLIGDNSRVQATFVAGVPNANDDWVGALFAPLLPGLEPLSDNGGLTPTHALSAGSIAIDKGRCANQVVDQRGFGNPSAAQRSVDDPAISDAFAGCDIGAFELGAIAAPMLIFKNGFEGEASPAHQEGSTGGPSG
jgi:hypothetical protein